MSTQSKLKARELEMKDRHHDEEMSMEREKSKRSAVSNIVGSVAGGLSKGFASGLFKKNHPEWYKKFGDYNLYANIPTWFARTQTTKGMVQEYAGFPAQGVYPDGRSVSNSLTLPSVLVHRFVPMLGFKRDGATNLTKYSINAAMKIVLTEIGKVNSRTVNPDNSIPGLYFLGATDIASCLGELKFMIDVIDQFSENDASIPKALIKAKGWDYAFVLKHIAGIRRMYDFYSKRFNTTLPVPKDFDLLNRRFWMNTVIIRDADTPKPVYQMFCQIAFGITGAESYSASSWENASTGYTDVRTHCIYSNSLQPLQEWLEHAFSSILDDDDYCTFIANLRAASSSNGFFVLPDINTSKVNISNLDEEVREQLMNIITLPHPFFVNAGSKVGDLAYVGFDANGDLYQPIDNATASTGYSLTTLNLTEAQVQATMACGMAQMRAMGNFNSFKAKLTPDDILVMTRLHPEYSLWETATSVSGELGYRVIINYVSRGTEQVVNSYLIRYQRSSGLLTTLAITNDLNAVRNTNGGGTAISSDDPFDVLSVDGLYTVYYLHPDSSTPSYLCCLTQWDNCFVIAQDNLQELHYLCSRSEYYCNPGQFKKF